MNLFDYESTIISLLDQAGSQLSQQDARHLFDAVAIDVSDRIDELDEELDEEDLG